MANINECILITRWVSDAQGNRPVFSGAMPAGCSYSDITGQAASILPCAPNVYLVRAFLTDTAYAFANGNANFIVLARRVYEIVDAVTPIVYSFNNFDDVPTGAQLTALKNLIQTRYPDVNDDALTEAGQAIIHSGLTRQQIIDLIIPRWRRFVKALV